jgi:hypothetical protein
VEEVEHFTYLYVKMVTKQIVVYIGISILSATYKILSNILLSRLTPYVEEIVGGGYNQYGFQCNISIADHIFCIHNLLEEKKLEYSQASKKPVYHLKKRFCMMFPLNLLYM